MTKHLTTLLLVLIAFTACNNRPTAVFILSTGTEITCNR